MAILVLLSPMVLLIASLIKLESPGPVLVRQRRYGFDGEPIDVFRFRTCHRGREVMTTVGRILHGHALDELPQFINVVLGSMSIVGPRPRRVAPVDEGVAWRRIKPGITGWAQVNGLWGEGASPDHFDRRARYDRYYVENWSLSFDLRINLQTLLVSFRRRSAA